MIVQLALDNATESATVLAVFVAALSLSGQDWRTEVMISELNRWPTFAHRMDAQG